MCLMLLPFAKIVSKLDGAFSSDAFYPKTFAKFDACPRRVTNF